MHTEDFGSNDCGNRKAVENVNECLPSLDITPSFAFIIEAINSRHIRAFVITPEKEEVLWILDLVAE